VFTSSEFHNKVQGYLSLTFLVGQPGVWRDESTTGGASGSSMSIHVLKLRLIQHQVKLTLNFGARPFRTHETTVQIFCEP